MRIRDLITIVEAAERPVDRRTLQRLLELVSDFVTRSPITDDLMDYVMQNWRRPAAPMTLWRVHVLTKAQANRLAKGITLPVYRYLSWTKSKDCIPRLAHARNRKKTGVVAVIEQTFPPEDICIDVQDFVDYLSNLEQEHPEYDFDWVDLVQYADEQEVIVAHHGPMLLNSANTTIFTGQRQEPKPGDKVYRPHTLSDDTYPILAVIGDNGDGTWEIEWHGGEDTVRPVAPGEWEVVEVY